MKTILYNELKAYGAFSSTLPKLIDEIVEANHFSIPYRMKAVIAVSELMSFASQFKRNIVLPDNTSVPINSITFCMAASGAHKDSSLRLTRKIFAPAYNYLEDQRVAFAETAAIQAAKDAGETLYKEKDIYKNYYEEPAAIFLKDVTPQGLVQYFNDIGKNPLGAGLLVNSEISDEFNTNPNFPDVIKILSEAYDLGIVEASYTKGKEFRNNGVSGIPFNALFIGSHYMLMFNPKLKEKLIASFMSKLSRRCSFVFAPDKMEEPVYASGLELVKAERETRDKAVNAVAKLSPKLIDIAKYNVNSAELPLTLSPEADIVSISLKRYDSEVAAHDCIAESADVLYRKNRYWRALKLAGALAILDTSATIELHHIISAINITELFNLDMQIFEAELNKADHERMSDYIQTLVEVDGRAFASLHELKKRGFTVTTTPAKLKELAALANAYDRNGVYSVPSDNTGIQYEAIIKSDVIGISYKPIDLSKLEAAISVKDEAAVAKAKSDIAATTAYGFQTGETSFEDLYSLLQDSYAYSPFIFTDGIRGKDHIKNGTSWGVLDIDKSNITAEETSFLLSDVQHIIALSSNPTNHFKYRILIKFDSIVDLPATEWKIFFNLLSNELGVQADLLPQSQIYFSYPNRTIYANLEASPLTIKDILARTKELAASKQSERPLLTTGQSKALLADKLNTFHFAFEAKDGEASRQVIRAIMYAKDLGADLAYSLELFQEIQEYWNRPFPLDRQEVFKNQITRLYS